MGPSIVRCVTLWASLALLTGCAHYDSHVEDRIPGREMLVATRAHALPGTDLELLEVSLRPAGDDDRLVCERVVLRDVETVSTYELPIKELREASCSAPLWIVVLPVESARSGSRGPYWVLPYSLRLAEELLEGSSADELLETKGAACVLFCPVLALDLLTLPYHLWKMTEAERDRIVTEERKTRTTDVVEVLRIDETSRLSEVTITNGRGESLSFSDVRAPVDLAPLIDASDRDVALAVSARLAGRPVQAELVLEHDDLQRLLRR